jgi:hypothetical protein
MEHPMEFSYLHHGLLAEEVLTLQSSELSGTFKVLGVDGPFHHDVYKKVDYTVRLSRI